MSLSEVTFHAFTMTGSTSEPLSISNPTRPVQNNGTENPEKKTKQKKRTETGKIAERILNFYTKKTGTELNRETKYNCLP